MPAAPVVGFSIDKLLEDVDWGPHEKSLGRWKQGHLVRGLPMSWLAASGRDPFTGLDHELGVEGPQWPEGTFDAIVCTQTCDLGATPPGNQHPTFMVAPLVHENGVSGSARRSLAAAGKLAYLIPVLPTDLDLMTPMVAAGEEAAAKRAERTGQPVTFALRTASDAPKGHRWYADLRLMVPVSKNALLARDPIEGFVTEQESFAFAETMAQKARRAALDEKLSEDLPTALEEFIRSNNPNSQCFAKVEQVRIHVQDGTRLHPTRAQLFVFSSHGELTEAEKDVWEKFNAKAKELLTAAGIEYAPIAHADINTFNIPAYRETAPVRSPLLGHTRWP